MGTGQVASLFITALVLLFLLKPIAGLVIDAFKVMLRLSVFSLALQLLPFEWIDSWSRSAVGWTHVAAGFVPVICLVLLIGLSVANISFLEGTKIEGWIKLALYIIGGVFAVGSAAWIDWQKAVGTIVTGFIALVEATIRIWKEAIAGA